MRKETKIEEEKIKKRKKNNLRRKKKTPHNQNQTVWLIFSL